MITEPKGDDMTAKDGYETLVDFLRSLTEARSLEEINAAAGTALQDLGEEADVDG